MELKVLDVGALSEIFNKAYINRSDEQIEILLSQELEKQEEEYVTQSVYETYSDLPSSFDVEYYRLTFSPEMHSRFKEWAEEFTFEAEEFDYPVMSKYIPQTQEQFQQLTDEQLFSLIVNFMGEVASVDWEDITFTDFLYYVN